MKLLTQSRLKWLAYILELFLVFIIQYTPNLLPSFLGVKPMLLVVCALSISMFESEGSAMWVGMIAGLLMDLSASKAFGFNTLVLMIICYLCGALVVFLMRNNIVSAMVIGIGGLLVISILRWFFFVALWGDPKTFYYLYAIMLPQLVYSAALIPVAFFFNRSLVSHMDAED